MKKILIGVGIVVGSLCAMQSGANAQTRLSRAVISNGGGSMSNGQTSGTMTVAQPVTGRASNGQTIMNYGFWSPGQASANVSSTAALPSSIDMKMWPNPAIGATQLLLTTPKNSAVTITLTDAAGHQLMTKTVEESAGTRAVSLDLTGLANGAYFVSASIPGEIIQQRLNVIR